MGSIHRRGFVLGALLLSACLSPSLPLPPPYAPSVEPSKLGADYRHLVGRNVEPGAQVFVYNNDAPPQNRGVIVDANAMGEWEADVFAQPGHVLRIWQRVRDEESAFILVTIR